MLHQCFIDEGFILQNLACLGELPTTIVHGRYDVVCKVEAAYHLHQKLANSQLFIVPCAGHSTSEPAISAALVKASNDMARFVKENAK